MKKTVCVLISSIGMLVLNSVQAEEKVATNPEIKSFANDLCSLKYKYDKTTLTGKLNAGANATAIKKILGIEISGEGEIKKETGEGEGVSTENLPADKIAEVILGSTSCKSELVTLLVKERISLRDQNWQREQDEQDRIDKENERIWKEKERIRKEEEEKKKALLEKLAQEERLKKECEVASACEVDAKAYLAGCEADARNANINHDKKAKICQNHANSKLRKCWKGKEASRGYC